MKFSEMVEPKDLGAIQVDLGEQVDFWSWINLAKRPIDVNAGEAPCSMASLEMLQYKGTSETVCTEGRVEFDSEICSWLEKVSNLNIGWSSH